MSSNVESVSEGSLQKNSHKNCDEEYNTIQYNYNTIQYNTIQYNTIQYNTIQ